MAHLTGLHMQTKKLRRLKKYKGCLYCQWCFRWTQTDQGKLPLRGKKHNGKIVVMGWDLYSDLHQPNFFCKRPSCVTARTT